jgi:membrane-associated protein
MVMIDPMSILQGGSLLIIALIIFAESGMMVGLFFPGDTLLLSAGILAAQGKLPLVLTLLIIAGAAILGDNIGYHIGKNLGPRLFRKKDGLIFRKDYIMKAEKFYEKYGSKTMLVAHFVPIVRSFAPVTAGAGKMPYGQFFIFDAVGCILWAFSITLFGYFVASQVPGIEHYVEPVLLLAVASTLLPTVYHILKDPKVKEAIKDKFKRTQTTKTAPDEK